jgi:hypothetical protein
MTGNAAENGPPAQHQDKRGWVERIAHQGTAALTCGYLVVTITGLIVLRAKVHGLEFIGIGWLLD